MASRTAMELAVSKMVGMGQILLDRKPTCLTAVLGSCVGVALYHPRWRIGALGHVVLPDAGERTAPPGRFANTAIPRMLQLLEQEGAGRLGLLAKIAGGACMFGTGGPMQIGEANVQAVLRALQAAGVPLAGKDVGGTNGRRIALDCDTGQLAVDSVAYPPRVL
jgi:chemotaxis protein CheD